MFRRIDDKDVWKRITGLAKKTDGERYLQAIVSDPGLETGGGHGRRFVPQGSGWRVAFWFRMT